MNTELHIGNISPEATGDELSQLFSQQGQVSEVRLALDSTTGRPRGFAFVTMATSAGAMAARQGLNGQIFRGRFITVNEAHLPGESPPRAGGYTSSPRRSQRR